MSTAAHILVLDDDPHARHACSMLLSNVCRLTLCGSLADAREALSRHDEWCALIIDNELDGKREAGLDFVERVREQQCAVPVLVLTGHHEPTLINRAFRLGARYLVKPAEPHELVTFVATASLGEHLLRNRLRSVIARYVTIARLSATRADLLTAAVMGEPRDKFAARHCLSDRGVRYHVRELVRALQYRSLDALALGVFREAMAHPASGGESIVIAPTTVEPSPSGE